jgi:hypothetical protein
MAKRIGSFQLVDHGIENEQYFQGCGVAFTEFNECATGCGRNPAEALDDLIEQIACAGWDCDDLEARILADLGKRRVPKRPLARGDCYYYLSLRWSEQPSELSETDRERLVRLVNTFDALMSSDGANSLHWTTDFTPGQWAGRLCGAMQDIRELAGLPQAPAGFVDLAK